MWLDDDHDGFGDSAGTPFSVCVPITGQVTSNDDCDDSDAAVNPLAKDECNYKDDDCDRFVDEDEPPTRVWYDFDGDGYGDATGTVYSVCVPGGTQVTNNDDCDDSDSAVNPMAEDICNYKDDDCDCFVDEDDLPRYVWPDSDGDGYGDGLYSASLACSRPSGWSANDTDCDDTDGNVNPGATEACTGVDDDCDGSIDEGGVCYTGLCSDITSDTIWASGTTQTISCPVAIGGGAVLTIEDGVTVEFEPGGSLLVGDSSAGSISANGGTQGILFTSASSSRAAGDWDGLVFGRYHSYSWLYDVDVEYGGDSAACIDVQAGAVSLYLGTVRDCAGSTAISVTGGEMDFTFVEVYDNDGIGVAVDHNGYIPMWYDVDLTGNGDLPLEAPLASLGNVVSDTVASTYTGNAIDKIGVLGGAVSDAVSLEDVGVPFLLQSDLSLDGTASSPAALIIYDGVELQVAAGAGIEVGTSGPALFQAYSFTASDPSIVTSAESSPAAGDWDGIIIGAYDTGSYFENAELSYGGGNGQGNLVVRSTSGAGVDILDSTVSHSAAYGIYRDSSGTSLVNITNITYSYNALGNLY